MKRKNKGNIRGVEDPYLPVTLYLPLNQQNLDS